YSSKNCQYGYRPKPHCRDDAVSPHYSGVERV
ncbi:uncharacterized protein METZ01_LOCUS466109, partial [marine metagenome]